MTSPVLALTQGDPVGIGPELCLRAALEWQSAAAYVPLLVIERAAVEQVAASGGELARAARRLEFLPKELRDQARVLEVAARGAIAAVDPCPPAPAHADAGTTSRTIQFGEPQESDARGALAAVDLGLDLTLAGVTQALVTAPLSKVAIARYLDPQFRGHTEHLARRCAEHFGRGDLKYGRDYLMAFLSPDLRVALLSTHVPLQAAIGSITTEAVLTALRCLDRHGAPAGGRRIALAGLNPHAGEEGLLGSEDREILSPAVEQARSEGIDVVGPVSPDTVFMSARTGRFDWVLALYHDQGLIAVKTVAWGTAVNWTMGLPIVRTSVDHGTAYQLAGRGLADPSGLFAALDAAALLCRSQPSSADAIR